MIVDLRMYFFFCQGVFGGVYSLMSCYLFSQSSWAKMTFECFLYLEYYVDVWEGLPTHKFFCIAHICYLLPVREYDNIETLKIFLVFESIIFLIPVLTHN